MPMSVIVIYRSGSTDGKDLKLYINGALEDYSSGTIPPISGLDVETGIGGQWLNETEMFSGKMEEVIVYNHAVWIPDKEGEFVISTADLPYTVDASSIYQAKMFGFDYHNIRGSNDTAVASTNQISWKVTKA